MHIDFVDHLFVAHCTFEERLAFKDAGWVFDPILKHWVTDAPKLAYIFRAFMSDAAMAELDRQAEISLRDIELSQAGSSGITVPAPVGLKYDPHQLAAIEYAVPRSGTLIADPPGLGKTIIAIGVSNYLPEIRKVLIVPPAHLVINWQREWSKWCIKGLSIGMPRNKMRIEKKVNPVTGLVERNDKGQIKYRNVIEERVWPGTNVIICPYSKLTAYHDALRKQVWDMVIFDESHYLANAETVRTMQALGAPATRRYKNKPARGAIESIPTRKHLFMTGTPVMSRPVELWPTVHTLDPFDLGKDWIEFTKRYCNAYLDTIKGRKFWNTFGASHLDELQAKLRSKFMVRRDKVTVMKNLPPKRRQLIELPREGLVKVLDEEMAAFQAVRDAMEEFAGDRLPLEQADKGYWERLASVMETKFGNWADEGYVASLRNLSPPEETAFEQLSSARKALAIAKVPMIVEHLQTYIDAGEKVVCFIVHTALAKALHEAFPKAVVVTGAVSTIPTAAYPHGARQNAVDKFQTDPDCPLFIGNYIAAGTGLTLTAARIWVGAELEWIPALIEQAEDRCWRRGQEQSVLAQHLVVEGSIDSHMVEVLLEKHQITQEMLDSKFLDSSRTRDLLLGS